MKLRSSSVVLALALLLTAGLASCGDHDVLPGEAACALKPSETFHERIEPLLTEDHPSTCNECHLSGVDLSAFARETPCKTWACLVDQGLVNTKSPDDSKILAWIERATPNSDLITPEVIAAEHDAFRDWIEANAQCPTACEGVTCGDPGDGPNCTEGTEIPDPDETAALALPAAGGAGGGGASSGGGGNAADIPEEDTRGCTDTDLEQAFADDVYMWRGRCSPCHFETELTADKDAPRWISTRGNCGNGSAETFKRVRDLGLINADQPEQSLILLKPLDRAGGGIAHGGGQKFADKTDFTYQSFLRFVTHYKQCTSP